MLNLNAAVCDDEKIFHKEISVLIRNYTKAKGIDIFVDFYENGEGLLRSERKYDIIFLDYQMKGINGIETAEKLRAANSDSVIIFISAYPTAALDAFEIKTFRFIVKPVDEAKLYKALDDYIKSIDYDNILLLKTQDGSYKLRMSEIIYLEADGKHTIVHTKSRHLCVHINLKQLEIRLPDSDFIRCSREYVVGFAHISNHNGTEIMFDNGENARIGKHYASRFKKEFQKYIIRYNEVHWI